MAVTRSEHFNNFALSLPLSLHPPSGTLLLLLFVIAVTTKASLIGGDGEAEELIAIADDGGSARAAHFVGVQLNPNPHKRSAYRVIESLGLHSHFAASNIEDTAPFYLHDNSAVDGGVDDSSNELSRLRRNAEVDAKEDPKEEKKVDSSESLPTAAAQTSEAGYYRRARSRLSDGDSMAQPSGDQVGLRRVPRVNFVTQPRSLSPDELPEHRDLKGSPASLDPLYHRRPYDPYMRMPPQYYSRDMSRGRFFDNNYAPSAYDRYDPMMMRDYGRQQAAYDPYYGRYNQMYNYNQQQGYYPYRQGYDYQRSGYMNDVNYMGHPTANRRVVYYANLPEVVRNGGQYGENRGYYQGMRGGGGGGGYGGGDMGYMEDPSYYENNGGYNRYMDDYNYRYNRDMNQYGMPPMPQPPPSVLYANRDRDRIPERDSNKDSSKNNKDTDSKTQTVSSNIRIQDSSNKGYRNGNNGGGSNHNQAPTSDFTQPHYRME